MTVPVREAHVVVIGGYGFFGQRLVERLSAHASLTVAIAGAGPGSGRYLAPRRAAHCTARNRYRWFGRSNACILPPPSVAQRFLD
ncbi:hypothetical protein [Ralstonia sp. UBA689]|uniref:hypothetical protein n=1 Tax=Ralstonia sp. UBA689 TaxID=1947373 RepID=UPI0025D5DC19|nr:hypothetical protein [Ralstonia sp. UBA689]